MKGHCYIFAYTQEIHNSLIWTKPKVILRFRDFVSLYKHKIEAVCFFFFNFFFNFFQQFFTIKMSERESMVAHIKKYLKLVEQVVSIKEKVSNLCMIIILLESLSGSY